MSIFFEEEGIGTLSIACEKLTASVIEAALEYMEFPYEAEVSVLLTDNETIQSMNNEFRHMDRATDVLSFPMIEYVQAGVFDFLEETDIYFHPDTGEAILGDIVISKQKVIEQASAYGHSIAREYAFLIAHSMLHLFGFDHIDETERGKMEEMQETILNHLQITRF